MNKKLTLQSDDLKNRGRRNNVHMKRIKEAAKKEGLVGLTGWI